MPDLPSISVTTAQAQRCLAAWGTTLAYKKWLAGQVREYVRASERDALVKTKNAEVRDGLAAIDTTDPLEGV